MPPTESPTPPPPSFVEIRDAVKHLLAMLEAANSAAAAAAVVVHERPSRSGIGTPAPYVTIQHAAAMTGYSVKAIESKIDRGDWREGLEWLRAPDGRRLISIAGFARWVESERRS